MFKHLCFSALVAVSFTPAAWAGGSCCCNGSAPAAAAQPAPAPATAQAQPSQGTRSYSYQPSTNSGTYYRPSMGRMRWDASNRPAASKALGNY